MDEKKKLFGIDNLNLNISKSNSSFIQHEFIRIVQKK